jgi:hypothetical protein
MSGRMMERRKHTNTQATEESPRGGSSRDIYHGSGLDSSLDATVSDQQPRTHTQRSPECLVRHCPLSAQGTR